MNWNKFFAPYKAWEKRMRVWIQTQPEYASIVSCADFFRDWVGDDKIARLEAWTKQAAFNEQIETMLRLRYDHDVEKMPNVETAVFL